MSIFSKKSTTPVAEPTTALNSAAIVSDTALRVITDGVMVVDMRGLVKLINPAGAKLLGYNSIEDVIGLDYRTALNITDKDGNQLRDDKTAIATAFIEKRALVDDTHYKLTKANDPNPIEISLQLLPANNPPQNDCVFVFRDITTITKTEGQQMEFIATASHEMRTPVASIEGYLSLALNPRTATIDDRAKQYLDTAYQACKHLGQLFKDLLDVTKLTDGQMHLHLTPVEITAEVQNIVNNFNQTEVAQKHIYLSFGDASPANVGIPTIQQRLYSSVDIDFLYEIVNNLIENAVKYTPEGGHVNVATTGDQENVIISVNDTGIGISSEDLPHIFQRFYRADNTDTRTIGGTGLGLYLVKQRAEALGGHVWAESTPGRGSVFYVSLPRLSDSDYMRMQIASKNEQMMNTNQVQNNNPKGGNNNG